MKKKEIKSKLSLSKETVSILNDRSLQNVKGGGVDVSTNYAGCVVGASPIPGLETVVLKCREYKGLAVY